MAEPLQTREIQAPDGSVVRYPFLPNVGEKREQHAVSQDHTSHPQDLDLHRQPPIAEYAARQTWRERVLASTRALAERVGHVGQSVVEALVLDDWKVLTNAKSTNLQKVEAGADLASWAIPEARIAELAGHAAAKAAEIAAAHMTTSGVEHGGETGVAAGLGYEVRRALADVQRSGSFRTFKDFKNTMGPATERGGAKKDWHHIVERTHADDTHQFAGEDVHNIHNIIAVPRSLHQGRNGLTSAFSKKDPVDGLSTREFLKDKPWETHVLVGEEALRARGLDPVASRAETLERFNRAKAERGLARGENGPGLSGNNAGFDRPPRDSVEIVGEPSAGLGNALHVERGGTNQAVSAGQRFEGTIQSVEGDRIVQNLGRGRTAEWSRSEFAGSSRDADTFNAMIQPGNFVSVGMNRNGVIDVQQRLPDHSWRSSSDQPLAPRQQPHVASHGR